MRIAADARSLSPLAKERGVAIQARLPGEPALILGDRDELLRIAENLIENAIKYGESGGRVDVEIFRVEASAGGHGARVAFSVQDYGPGIAPEIVDRTRITFAVTFEPSRETAASFRSQIASGCLFSSFG